ncbi:MAG: peptidylprolyl isomerase [Eggerthellaceae bacterium]|nr:peptidylprolyl isomerase [Eggerthellaceae bacterium]
MNNEGKFVKVHYIGTLDDGTEFDSSVKTGKPLEFVCMAGQMIKGFDNAVRDMEVGETKKVHILAKDAYGTYRDDLVQIVELSKIPNGEDLPVGQTVYFMGQDGYPFPVRVVSIEEGKATFDLNHELAGKDLNFEITLLDSSDELPEDGCDCGDEHCGCDDDDCDCGHRH